VVSYFLEYREGKKAASHKITDYLDPNLDIVQTCICPCDRFKEHQTCNFLRTSPILFELHTRNFHPIHSPVKTPNFLGCIMQMCCLEAPVHYSTQTNPHQQALRLSHLLKKITSGQQMELNRYRGCVKPVSLVKGGGREWDKIMDN